MFSAFAIIEIVNKEKFFGHFGASILLKYAYEYPVNLANSFNVIFWAILYFFIFWATMS